MAAPRYPTEQFLAGQFVVSAGSILFHRASPPASLKICVLHHLTRDEWLLPKGRKDRGETNEQAAVRETFEETGYPCALWPQRIPTQAPAPGINDIHHVEEVEGITEPIGVTIRHLRRGGVKIIWWYITLVKEGAEKIENTQMAEENFESMFVDAKDALACLTFQSDREIVQKALDIVDLGDVQRADSKDIDGGTLTNT